MERKETIKVSGLATGYTSKHGKIVITDHIDASLYSGELTCLLGPNGAGKSTLLKTLCAFLQPLSGTITINGNQLKTYSDSELAKIIGVVLTEKISLNNMSVEELISMGRSPYTGFWGRLSTYDRKIVNDAISLVKIESLRGRMTQTLSDGERQKVMIAKSLAQETPVIFLDEPTAFLDYPSKVEIMQLLQSLAQRQNKTIFLSTHDLELALQIADKIWLIDKNLGVRIGTPEDLSINGELGKFFQREGVTFDIESGLFRIDNVPQQEICVLGSGNRFNMVKKALRRVGINPTTNESIPHTIIVKDDRYLINGMMVDSIEKLLDAVRDITLIGNQQHF